MNRVKDINKVYLVTVLTAIAGSMVMSVFEVSRDSFFFLLLFSQTLLILPMLGYVITTKQNILQVIRFRKIKPVNIILAIIFAYLITPLMTLLNAISLLFSTNVIDDKLTNVVDNNPLVLSVFVIALIPCIFEESVYRGVFLNEYRKVNPLRAIILSGLLFGLMHMNFNQFIYAFAMGTIFAFMIEATDSILTTMIIHFVINGNSVVLTYMMPKIEAFAHMVYGDDVATKMFPEKVEYTVDTLLPVIMSYAVIASFTTVLAILLFILMAKIEGRWETVVAIFHKKSLKVKEMNPGINVDTSVKNNEKLGSFALVAGIVICVVIMVWIEVSQRI